MATGLNRRMRHDLRLLPGVAALVGVDEAGRGALAGPVTAAAVLAWPQFFEGRWFARRARHVNDSKQVPPALREALCDEILAEAAGGTLVAVAAQATVAEIEERNILGATQLAMRRAIERVRVAAGIAEAPDPLFCAPVEGAVTLDRCRVLVDGRPLKALGCAHEAIVGGDGKSLVIAMASIVAKVSRDRHLAALDAACPGYGLADHKGYATPSHLEAITRLGATPHHRETFLRKLRARIAAGEAGQLWLEVVERGGAEA